MEPLMMETTRQQPVPPFTALEIAGAVSARVVHDLSNLISVIVGNAEFAQTVEADHSALEKCLAAISTSANDAGKLLGQCLPLQPMIAREIFPVPVMSQVTALNETFGPTSGWRVTTLGKLDGKISVQPRWLTAAVSQLVRETEAGMGDIEVSCGPAIFPVVWNGANLNKPPQLFQILLRYRGDLPLMVNGQGFSSERLGVLATMEMVRRFKGQIHCRPKPPGRQEISLLLPLL